MKKCIIEAAGIVLLIFSMLISGCRSTDTGSEKGGPSLLEDAGTVYYSQFGAKGDGVTDDFGAIIAAHEAANKTGAKVCADQGAVYYIGGAQKTARIRTNTDWTGAEFIIDDTKVARDGITWADSWIFEIVPAHESFLIDSVRTLQKNQAKLDLSLPFAAVLVPSDSRSRRFIRMGLNENTGVPQTEVFIVDKNGNVDMSAPIVWDFKNITSLTAYPIDEKILTVTGGKFTTIANIGKRGFAGQYLKRGIRVTRSNTVIDGIVHLVTGEDAIPPSQWPGTGYNGFIQTRNCANVTVKNTTFTGHRSYSPVDRYDPAYNLSVVTSSYDLTVQYTVNFSAVNCDQSNGITDTKYWGIFTSNYSKNIVFDNVKFSRFDAHQGVCNTTILNSELGYMGIYIIGNGLLRVENTKVTAPNFLEFRNDYGATWEGDVIIRNCTFAPMQNLIKRSNAVIVGANNGQWNFGYPCYMPETVTIDGFVVDETSLPPGYNDIVLIHGDNDGRDEPYPYTITKTLNLSGFVSGKPYRVATNDYLISKIRFVEK
jgi:hypothetical protein